MMRKTNSHHLVIPDKRSAEPEGQAMVLNFLNLPGQARNDNDVLRGL